MFVDTAPVMEKPLAAAAGLGWQGKHTNLVSRDFGSWLFLGAILTTLELPPDARGATTIAAPAAPASTSARPTAFPAPYQLDARRCISYLTIEHKGPIPREFRAAMGNRIYGCDDCLAVCPWNKFAQAGPRGEARRARRRCARRRWPSWRGSTTRRSARCSPRPRSSASAATASCATCSSRSAIRAMRRLRAEAERLLDDASPLVRGAAVWALSRLAAARQACARSQQRTTRQRKRDDDASSERMGRRALASGID